MVDTAVIDLYAAMPSDPSTNADYRAALDAIGAQLGQVSMRDGHPAPSEMQYSARWGTVTRAGLVLSFPWLSLYDGFDGAPALAAWLCSKDCIGLKYNLQSGDSFGLDEEQ